MTAPKKTPKKSSPKKARRTLTKAEKEDRRAGRAWQECVSSVYADCEASGENFDHKMGAILGGVDDDDDYDF